MTGPIDYFRQRGIETLQWGQQALDDAHTLLDSPQAEQVATVADSLTRPALTKAGQFIQERGERDHAFANRPETLDIASKVGGFAGDAIKVGAHGVGHITGATAATLDGFASHIENPEAAALLHNAGGGLSAASESAFGLGNSDANVQGAAFAREALTTWGDVSRVFNDAAGKVTRDVAREGAGSTTLAMTRDGTKELQTVLAAAEEKTPLDFANWFLGPHGPSVEGVTAQIPGFQQHFGEFMDGSMNIANIANPMKTVFGFGYVPVPAGGELTHGDFYTTSEHSIQSQLGFHDIVDKFGKPLGMDLDDKVVEFESGGTEYRLELWKGSYGAGGAFGGEIGLYTRGSDQESPGPGGLLELIPGWYSSAYGSDQIAMTQEIFDKNTDKPLFINDGKGTTDGTHFWNLAIRTDPGVTHGDLGQRGTLEFNDPAVAHKAYEAMQQMADEKDSGLSDVRLEGNRLSYTWE